MATIKVKIFTHCTQNINPESESQINAWFAENPDIEIVKILQTESMVKMDDTKVERNLSISIFYK